MDYISVNAAAKKWNISAGRLIMFKECLRNGVYLNNFGIIVDGGQNE